MERNKLFENYFDSIFSKANMFSREIYERACEFYELNYGVFLPLTKNARILRLL